MAKRTIEQVDVLITRNRSRLKRTMTALDKLEKERKRLLKGPVNHAADLRDKYTKRVVFEPEPLFSAMNLAEYNRGTGKFDIPVKPDVDDGIPEFLRRGQAAQAAVNDVIAAEKIKAEQAEVKTAKARGRIAKMKAKKAGDLKKMPLSGRAALDAIKNG